MQQEIFLEELSSDQLVRIEAWLFYEQKVKEVAEVRFYQCVGGLDEQALPLVKA